MDIKELLGDLYTNEIAEKLKDVKLLVDDGNLVNKADYIPRKVYNEDKQKLQSQLEERTKEIDKLAGELKNVEGASEKIADLQNKMKDADAKNKAELKQAKIDAAVEIALIKANAKHPELLKHKIVTENLVELPDGTFSGVKEQIDALKQNGYSDQFGETKVAGDPPGAGNPPKKKTELDDMQKTYDDMLKNGKAASPDGIALKRRIFEEQQKQE